MEVVRFCPCFRGGFRGADISWGIMVLLKQKEHFWIINFQCRRIHLWSFWFLNEKTISNAPMNLPKLLGSDEGDVLGSDEGDVLWSDEGDVLGSDEGDVLGSDEGDVLGSDEGDVLGSDEGDVLGSDEGDVLGSDEGDV